MKSGIALILALALLPDPAEARWPSYGFYFENDVDFLSGENNDRFYTNGVRIDVGWPNCTLPKVLRKQWERRKSRLEALDPEERHTEGRYWIPFVPDFDSRSTCTPRKKPGFLNPELAVFGFGLRLGHHLYTPDDLDTPFLQTRDRPYAGWLYAGAVVSRMSVDFRELLGREWRVARMRSMALDLGVVGPSAYGEEIQDWVHREITKSREAQGWQHQLRDEPAVLFTWDERWRVPLKEIVITRRVDGGEATGPVALLDFVPRYYANLGNVFTQVAASGTVRFGWNVPEDFGPAVKLIALQAGDPEFPLPNRWEVYGFLGAEARGVARNIFLDGNLFASSHSVPKKHLVTDLEWGFVVRYREVRLTYRRVRRSEEFAFQPERQRFGSLNLTWNIPYKRN